MGRCTSATASRSTSIASHRSAPRATRTSLPCGPGFWKCSPRSTPFCERLWLSCTNARSSPAAAKLAAFRDAGVNRASLGVQSLNAAALGFLGRKHDVPQAIAALEAARGIFPRLSFDLIYVRPGQQEAAWRAELRQALALAADHLSLYQLTIEPGTQFETLYRRGAFALPAEDDAARLYLATAEEAARFVQDTGVDALAIAICHAHHRTIRQIRAIA